MALLRHAGAVMRCPFIGSDRTWLTHGQNDAIDPIADIGPEQHPGPIFCYFTPAVRLKAVIFRG